MRWIKVCGVGAGALVLGVLILYLGPFYQLGSISSLLDVRPIYLLPGGALVVLVGVAAVVVSFARSPAGSTAGGGRALFADIAAPIGLPIAATAILTFLSTYLASNLLFAGPGPCDYSTTPECFGAHPDYC